MNVTARSVFVPSGVAAFALAGMLWPGIANAQDRSPVDPDAAPHVLQPRLGPQWIALPTERLAALRGGYELPSGLLVSFGIERVAYVNGALVASASLNIADVSRMTPQQAAELAALSGPMVVQVGSGNVFNAGGAMGGVVIQNTLDNQAIRTMTTLNIAVGTLGLFQDLNSYNALQNALLNVPGGP